MHGKWIIFSMQSKVVWLKNMLKFRSTWPVLTKVQSDKWTDRHIQKTNFPLSNYYYYFNNERARVFSKKEGGGLSKS